MGFARRMARRTVRKAVRKTVRAATPRPVRKAVHPVRTATRAVTPQPVRQVGHAVYAGRHPVSAAGSALTRPGSGTGRSSDSASREQGRTGVGTPAVRAAEAVASRDQIAGLMAIARQQFAPAERPVIPAPKRVSPVRFRREEWASRKRETRFWQRSERRQLRREIAAHARDRAAKAFSRALTDQKEQQATADAQWEALCAGEPGVLASALEEAFSRSHTPIEVRHADGSYAALTLVLPAPQVLPEKKAHITPTGKLSSRAWTKTELNEAYAQLLGAHLIFAARQAWAAAPSLTEIRLTGVRLADGRDREVLFDTDLSRAPGQWEDNGWGYAVLHESPRGLNRKGKSQEVIPWPTAALGR
jgi:hypothetical protein